MKDTYHSGSKKIARRSVLSGAFTLGSGAALTAAVPSLALTAANSAAEASPPQSLSSAAAAAPAANPRRFTPEFLSNKVFSDLALNFDPPNPSRIDGKLLQTGALVQPSGDILFRIDAPKAHDVTLKFDLVRSGQLTLIRQSNGIFEGLLPYDDSHTGPMTVDVYIDGMLFLYPHMPIHWSAKAFSEDKRLSFTAYTTLHQS